MSSGLASASSRVAGTAPLADELTGDEDKAIARPTTPEARSRESSTRVRPGQSMQELLGLTFARLGERVRFQVEGSAYPKARVA